jgi:hypothetical protein
MSSKIDGENTKEGRSPPAHRAWTTGHLPVNRIEKIYLKIEKATASTPNRFNASAC